jgi:hypothetical protein
MSFEIWCAEAAMYVAMTVTLSVFVSYLEHRLGRTRDMGLRQAPPGGLPAQSPGAPTLVTSVE